MPILEEFDELVDIQFEIVQSTKRLRDLVDSAILKRNQYVDRLKSYFATRWLEQFPGIDHSLDSTTFETNFDSDVWDKALHLRTIGDEIYYEISVGWFRYDEKLTKIECTPPVSMKNLENFLGLMEKETGVRFVLGEA